MSGPVLLAVDEDASALRDVERELRDRYARHYRVIGMRSSHEARACLEDLAAAGEEVAVVLAGQWLSGMTGSELFERGASPSSAREARAADRVGCGGGTERRARRSSTRSATVASTTTCSGRRGHRTSSFAISSLLLEWAEARRALPHTDDVVGESWSGRAYELRDLLGRCAMPHSFCLAEARPPCPGGQGGEAASRRLSRRHGPGRPQRRRARDRGGLAG